MCLKLKRKTRACDGHEYKSTGREAPSLEAVQSITSEQWHKCIKHVEKEDPRFWVVDNSMEEVADVVINLGSDDSSESN